MKQKRVMSHSRKKLEHPSFCPDLTPCDFLCTCYLFLLRSNSASLEFCILMPGKSSKFEKLK
jgi:hypothetical protein